MSLSWCSYLQQKATNAKMKPEDKFKVTQVAKQKQWS